MKQLKHILSFLFFLILQIYFTNNFASINTNEKLCASSSIEFLETAQSISEFSELNFKESYIFESSFHDIVSCPSVSCCGAYTDLVEGWKVLSELGDDIPDLVRTNTKNLESVSNHINKGVHSSDDIATGIGKAADKQKWLDDLGNGVYRNGDKAEYVNPSGNILKWTDQHPNSISQSIESALNSTDAGKAIEGK